MNGNYIDTATDTFNLEQSTGADYTTSFEQAVHAAVAQAYRGFVQDTRDDLLAKAEVMDLSETPDMDDLSTDGPASLIWYAACLDETLPYEDQLENHEQGR
jgi:hypothetical protein